MSVKKISALMAVPFIALSLSACGSNSSDNKAATSETSTSQKASPSKDASPSMSASGSSNGADSAAKPSREEVKAGLKKLLEAKGLPKQLAQHGATEEHINSFYGCITDNIYEGMSAKTLRALINDDRSANVVSPEEQKKYIGATRLCALQLQQQIKGKNAG